VPMLANMGDGGRTPILDRAVLEDIGYKLAIFPVTALLAATQAMEAVYRTLKAQGSSAGLSVPLTTFDDLTILMGFPEVHEFERRWADPE
jgi:2,3-dimethylmalate lyase